jgi:hypothetical protein
VRRLNEVKDLVRFGAIGGARIGPNGEPLAEVTKHSDLTDLTGRQDLPDPIPTVELNSIAERLRSLDAPSSDRVTVYPLTVGLRQMPLFRIELQHEDGSPGGDTYVQPFKAMSRAEIDLVLGWAKSGNKGELAGYAATHMYDRRRADELDVMADAIASKGTATTEDEDRLRGLLHSTANAVRSGGPYLLLPIFE